MITAQLVFLGKHRSLLQERSGMYSNFLPGPSSLGATDEPGSKLVVLGMAIPPLIGNPYNGYINSYGIGLMSLSPIWK